MPFLILIVSFFVSSASFAVESLPKKNSAIEDNYTRGISFDWAASDLRIRQLQKLANDNVWKLKESSTKKSAKK